MEFKALFNWNSKVSYVPQKLIWVLLFVPVTTTRDPRQIKSSHEDTVLRARIIKKSWQIALNRGGRCGERYELSVFDFEVLLICYRTTPAI